MSDIAIRVENLSKIYKLYDDPKDRMREALHPMRKKYHREFFALNNVSLEVMRGETVGIIGMNGSGKSTLLKIITGVLRPSLGAYQVSGKVSSLLELGTGFNPELTGLENVYFSGIVLGSTNEEMDGKIDHILAFASIGDFIHQPVKTYSSGMYIRLAFAVAINVDPDVLIIDEALAVGDIRFQQKCFRKLNEFREARKTIIFCSHDIGTILNLCSSCVWLHQGSVKAYGEPESITKKYQSYMYYELDVHDRSNSRLVQNIQPSEQELPWQNVEDYSFFGEGGASITHACFYDEETKEAITILKGGEKVVLGIRAEIFVSLEMPIYGFNVKNNYGVVVFGTNTFQENTKFKHLVKGDVLEAFFYFRMPPLSNGDYIIEVSLANGTQAVHVQHCWKYDVITFKMTNVGEKYVFGTIYLNPDQVKIEVNGTT